MTREEAVKDVRNLVIDIALRYYGLGVEMEDLIQSGMEGVLIAYNKFDPEAGTKFSTYAFPWIEKKIRATVDAQGRDIRLPEWVHNQLVGPVDRATKTLEQQLARRPTIAEIAFEAGLAEDEVESAIGWMSARTVDIDSPDLKAVQSDEPGPEELTNETLRNESVAGALDMLSERHRDVLELRFGLRDGRIWTTREVGVELGISGSAVAKAEAEALRALRAHPTARRNLRGWI